MTRIRKTLAAAAVLFFPLSAYADTGQTANATIWGLSIGLVTALLTATVFWRRMRVAESAAEKALTEAAQSAEETRQLISETVSFAAVLDALPMPVWRRDGDLTLVDCNTAYSELLERSRDDVLRHHLELGAHSIDMEGRGLASRAIGTGITLTESHHVVHGGERHLFEFSEVPLSGNGSVGHAMDVSALEHVQSELSSHIAAHGEVLESLATAIAIFGPDRRLKFFNNAFVELWDIEPSGLQTEPLIGELLEILRERRVLPEYVDFPAFRQEQERLFVSLLERQEELMHLPDGRTLRRAVSPHPFGGLLFVFEDVTDRLALERSYNTLIEVQRETINNLHEGVAVIGQNGRLQLWNPTLLEMWELDPAFVETEPHIGELFEATQRLFPETDDWPARKERLVLQIIEGAARVGRLERVDESVLDFACVPLPDGGCLISYVDVTDTVRVQRALEERNMALEMADQVKTEFIANVSYELRTPLNTIAGFTDVLDGELFGDLNPRQKEYVGGIITASRQLTELIDDILDLATIEAGYMALDLQLVSVADILVNVRDSALDKIESGRLKIEVDHPPDIGQARIDRTRMTKALFNLLWNSVMFQSDDNVITLRAARKNGKITVEVDDSIGIVVNDDISDLYDTFEHGDPYVRRTGSGLGLALTRSLVELHGGDLQIRNDKERGTHAIAQFPAEGPSATRTRTNG